MTKIIYEPKGPAREYAPLAANLYRGCGHGCIYCYAPNILKMKRWDFYHNPEPRKDILKNLERELATGEYEGKRILLSFTSDPYQRLEDRDLITRNALLLFVKYGVNWDILTKAGGNACVDFGLYRKGDRFGSTLTFMDPHESKRWEPHAAIPTCRFSAIKKAHSMGIPTWVSLEPVIDPDQTFEIIWETHAFVDEYRVGKLNYHPRSKEIDWHRFTKTVVGLLEGLGKKYLIKDSLEPYLEGK